MGQIVKRKKKGRPCKVDLAKREAAVEPSTAAAVERDLRRSLRRRNVRYTFDIDDYLDEDDYEDEEDEIKREKKLKLLLKLHSDEGGAESAPSGTPRVSHAPAASASSSDYGDGNKPLKKRKMDGDDEIDDDIDDDDDDDDEVRGIKAEAKGVDSAPGTPSEPPSGRLLLSDKKTLELILDKLQRKDIYGVYAEPVDPEELPDYHDVIEHPMDFATVRNKLGNGKYSTLEQFECDVFLICSNAMQYNAPDTIYHKQARSIQELAKKKFQRLRIDIERAEKELKSDEKRRCNSFAEKLPKKPMSRMVQESVGSDFSSGATLVTAGDFQHGSGATQASGCERPKSVDCLVEGITSLIDNNLDKSEELLPEKGLLSRFGRKQSVHDENHRATYNISLQSVASESIFTTFEGESKQLVPVGIHADHSYARSLARFSATLGPVAWKVASQRIEQALPAGFKFGRGWVGEYEPLPTPVLMLENCTLKEPAFLTNFGHTVDVRKDNRAPNIRVSNEEHPVDGLTLEKKITLFPAKEQPARVASLEAKLPFFCSPGTKLTASVNSNYHQQNSQSKSSNEPERKGLKQVELNGPPSANQSTAEFVAERQISSGSELIASRSVETAFRNGNPLKSVSFNRPSNNGTAAGGLSNGTTVSNDFDSNRRVSSSCDSFPNQMARAATYFPHGQEQGLSDPVQLMRTLAEKNRNQPKNSNHPPANTTPVVPPVQSPRRDDSGNAAAVAARAWMSIGAGGFKPATENTSNTKNQISADSLYNSSRDLQPQSSQIRGDFPVSGMHFQHEKNSFPLHGLMPPPVKIGNEPSFQNRPTIFPQFVTVDLSRFQVQSQWRGLNQQTQPRLKQESLPPDLNIGFQGSPVRQSSSVLVDSQQPDLALQL